MAEIHHRKPDVFPRYSFIFFGSIIYLCAVLAITATGNGMFVDTDPLWHLAAGDWIRAHSSLPFSDPWSFTTTGYQWLNISWGWDTLFSFIHETLGWHGAFALNAITLSATMIIIYSVCAVRSGSIIAALITLALLMPLLVVNVRPLQITALMTAAMLLILACTVRRQCGLCWLALIPVLTVVWVNSHGGFVIAPILLGAYFINMILTKNAPMARALFTTGIATAIAIICNPYHLTIIEAAWRPLTTSANQFIIEWQPVTTNPKNLVTYGFAILFIVIASRKDKTILLMEYVLAYFWLVMAVTSMRHMMVFAIVAAPIVACGIATNWQRLCSKFQKLPHSFASSYNSRNVAFLGLVMCAAMTAWLPTGSAANLYGHKNILYPTLKPEIDFIKEHHPDSDMLIDFDLAAMVVYESRGDVPVFIDPRTETAFPPEVIKDYDRFIKAAHGWEEILDKYGIDGIMLANDTVPSFLDRFSERRGWNAVFRGPLATIFIRDSHEKH